jgi:hypothetical protein
MRVLTLAFLMVSVSFFSACSPEPKGDINPYELAGVYQVDVKAILNSPEFKQNMPEELNSFSELMINFMAKSIEIKIAFNQDQSAGLLLDGKIKQMLEQFADLDLDELDSFQYKIMSDTLLMLKSKDDDDFVKAASLKKMGSGYDSLKFSLIDDDERFSLVLRKVNS